MRAGDARLLPGRAGRGLRLSRELLRRTPVAAAPRPARRARAGRRRRGAARREEADHHRRRRRALQRGDGCPGQLRRDPRRAGRRDPGRQVRRFPRATSSPSAPSASPAPPRPMRLPRRPTSFSPSARGCRISPPARGTCSAIPTAASSPSTSSPSTPTSIAPSPLVADARAGLDELSAALGRLARRQGLAARRSRPAARNWLEAAAPRHRPDQHRAAVGRAGDRRRPAPLLARHRRRQRRRRPARRTAQALAGRTARRLPHGIRLFLHGLRDRRRHRRQARHARPRRRRHGRRRLLPDDEFRDRHLGAARPEAHRRRPRQSRLRLHHPPAAGDRRRPLQQSVRGHRPRRRCRRSTSAPTPNRSAPSPSR